MAWHARACCHTASMKLPYAHNEKSHCIIDRIMGNDQSASNSVVLGIKHLHGECQILYLRSELPCFQDIYLIVAAISFAKSYPQ